MKNKPFNIESRPVYLLFFSLLLMTITLSLIKPKPTRIVFFGDSITQMGTDSGGYIDLISKTIAGKGLTDQYDLIGAGIGGNKIYDLYLRLEEDVLARKPDVVFIYVGVNDVWHKVWGTGTDGDKFEKFYTAVIQKIQAQGAEVILCTPAVIGEKTDFTNQQDGDLNSYSQIIRKLATSHNCKLVDLRRIFLGYNLAHNPDNLEKGILTTDGVHLTDKGNQLVAEAMLVHILKTK